ncbi:MAG: glycosyltransferase family 87 protein, partial [Candidatus Dormibacteraceae bacterium]
MPATASTLASQASSPLLAGRPRRSALANPRFQTLLLVVAGLPLALEYGIHGLLQPLLGAGLPGDLRVYLLGARDLAAGHPYVSYYGGGGWPDPGLRGGYSYPPLLAWALQPLAHVQTAGIEAAATILLEACLAVFLWAVIRALGVRDRHMAALLVLIALSFEPVWDNVYARQLNLVLLALTGLWFLGWVRGDRAWPGAALGLAVALKLLQGPLLLLTAWGHRWQALAAGAATAAVLTAIAAPGYWGVFITRVLGPIDGGTGYVDNQAPIAVLQRLVQPASLHGQNMPVPGSLRVAGILLAATALGLTFARLRRPRGDADARALEAAAVVALTPFLVALQ